MLKTTVNSREFDVTVTSGGSFQTELEGERIAAESMRELTGKLKARMAQLQQVCIPALLIEHDQWLNRRDGLRFRPVLLTGTFQGRHRDLTYREGDNPKSGATGTGHLFYRRITDSERAQLVELFDRKIEAERVWVTALKALQMDAAAEVEKAAYLGSRDTIEGVPPNPKRRKE